MLFFLEEAKRFRRTLIFVFLPIIIIIIITFLVSFFTPVLTDSFHWSLSGSKSLQISGTLLSILSLVVL